MNSKKFKLNRNDLIKGLIMTVLAAVLATAYQLLMEVGLDWTSEQYKDVLVIALTTGIAYILKNFFTDGQNQTADAQLEKQLKKSNRKKYIDDDED